MAAAHLSRNLLGDYGNLSVMGTWLRELAIPFWSWMEINARRWPRIGINAIELGKLKGRGDKTAVAVFTGVAMARLFTRYGLFWLWNNLVHPDEEDDLPPFARQNPHLIFGRNTDGSVCDLNNTGALGDFLEWFGPNTFLNLLPEYETGQITMRDCSLRWARTP